jgi:hypothetical protein
MQDIQFLDANLANQELGIDTPRLEDVPRLTELTRRLARTAETQSFRCPQTDAAWRSLIEAEDMVCAKTRDGRLAGFYAANQFALVHSADELPAVRAAHNVLCNRFKLPNQKVSFGAQAVIDLSRQNSDLRSHLLRALLRHVGLRYRYLFTAIEKSDLSEMQILPREGWRCFHEEDDACYMMLDVAKALRSLATHLLLRIPTSSERNSPAQRRLSHRTAMQ